MKDKILCPLLAAVSLKNDMAWASPQKTATTIFVQPYEKTAKNSVIMLDRPRKE